MSKKTQFERWLRVTQEMAVNEFGYTEHHADNLDVIDCGLMWQAGLTPYEALEELSGVHNKQLELELQCYLF